LVMQSVTHHYWYDVGLHCESFDEVELPMFKIKMAYEFAQQKQEAKQVESHHRIDGNQELKRALTGVLGEMAVELYLGMDFVDLSVGDSRDYNTADLEEFDCGVKTVERDKYPIIFKRSNKPEIIVIKYTDSILYVCGLATPLILNTYQSEGLILDPRLKARGTKAGFYGFDKLVSPKQIKYVLESNITWR
jgi:hypothetical protein